MPLYPPHVTSVDGATGAVDLSDAYAPLPSGTPTVGQVPVVTDDDPLTLGWGDGGSGLPKTFISRTTSYTAAPGDFVLMDCSGGGFATTLPADAEAGDLVTVRKVDSSSNVATVTPSGGGTIDGDADAQIVAQWSGAAFEHQGSNVWHIVALSAAGPGTGAPAAGDYRHIETVTLAANAAFLEFASIPSWATHLKVVGLVRGNRANAVDTLVVAPNGASTNLTYRLMQASGSGAAAPYQETGSSGVIGYVAGDSAAAGMFSAVEITAFTASSTSQAKMFNCQSFNQPTGIVFGSVRWNSTAAVTSLKFSSGLGTQLVAGTTLSLYGMATA